MARSTESRMDFEYDNRQGPVDIASPFIKYAAQNQLQQGGQKRNFGEFKKSELINAIPRLRTPAPDTKMLFYQPPQKSTLLSDKDLPPTPFSKNPAFTTPRKLESDYDSSGVENLSSPENNADSEATPENMGFRSQIAKTTNAVTSFLDKRQPKESQMFKSGPSSPSKAGPLQPFYSHGVEKRRRRNKSETEKRVALRKESSASDVEDNSKVKGRSTTTTVASTGPGRVASLFSFINTHPDLPHILSFYAQLLLNFFLVFVLIYLTYCFWSAIRSDVDKKSEEAITGILAEMAICAQNYRENKCAPETRMPALETVCNNWDRCMNKDPRALGRARVSAHTFAEIFNSFVEPISYKAMIFVLIVVFGWFAGTNIAFGGRVRNGHVPAPPSTYMQTPMRHFSGPQEIYWNNHQSPLPQEPGPSMGTLDAQTPVRRLQY